MFAISQIFDDLPEFIPVPPELRHCRRLEVIFLALDQQPDDPNPPPSLAPGASHVEHHSE
ncbi:hypothetical protein [Thiobaca trueperi]|uniref:Uncharacterized protein n=1 Tax=Thiobaca trueperi TaxID=127458 RepID=A0A4R3N259_9GAMM|nr:hypothetical protein [Thiobaca trueperi]TCT22036.1 hypothetical protein EDC35_103134 [Thiobaca trueperi]